MQALMRLWKDDSGTTAVEYAVLLALILISIIAAVSSVGTQNLGMWSGVKDGLDAVGFGGE